jgi:hypothetical protein
MPYPQGKSFLPNYSRAGVGIIHLHIVIKNTIVCHAVITRYYFNHIKLKQLNGTLLSRRAQQAITGGKTAVICVVWYVPFNIVSMAVPLPGNGACENTLQQCQGAAAATCAAAQAFPITSSCVGYCYEVTAPTS